MMQIKRFEARDMTSALRLIKNELGPDAVILSARNLKKENKLLGLVKTVGVEVTAAVDAYDLPVESKSVAFAGAMNAYRQYGPDGSSRPRKSSRAAVRRIKTGHNRKKQHRSRSDNRIAAEAEGLLRNVFERLRLHEVKQDLTADIVAGLNRTFADAQPDSIEPVISEITSLLHDKIGLTPARKSICSGPRLLAVVGATGVGKTATIAKLVARYALERQQKVALISLDSYRIGATAELDVYSRAAGIPLKTAATPAAFEAAVDACREFDLVLVDTPGLNPASKEEVDTLKSCLDGIEDLEIHLALSATTKESDLSKNLKSLRTLNIDGLIFTKLDESGTYGNVINFLSEHPLPLSYLASGRQLPEAIDDGSLGKIVKMMLKDISCRTVNSTNRGKDTTAVYSGVLLNEKQFVANKNSDVFHHINCKWTAKIKPKNLIAFSNADAARMKQFMPCRDCQPVKSEPAQIDVSRSRDSVWISNYS
jgi:flagellar biosynthesis protein FlhF